MFTVRSLFLLGVFSLLAIGSLSTSLAFEANHEPPAPQDQKWTRIGPGGGGWFKSVAFSPTQDKLIVGGDVSGVHVSNSTFNHFTLCNGGPNNTVGLINLYIQSIVFHPTDVNTVYVGTRGGVAKSTDKGLTWTMKRTGSASPTDYGLSEAIYALAIDPNSPGTLYAGLGVSDNFGMAYPNGITRLGYFFKTTNSGDTWTATAIQSGGVTISESIMAISIDPTNHNNIYLLSRKHIFKSTNAGVSWTELAALPDVANRAYTYLTTSLNNGNTLHVSYVKTVTPYETGILKSIDGGTTWAASLAATTMSNSYSGINGIYRHPSNANTLYTTFHASYVGLWRTIDAGASWSQINQTLTQANTWPWMTYLDRYATAFAINPRNTNMFCYTTSAAVYLTGDNGATWQQIASSCTNPYGTSTGLDILCATGTVVKKDDPSALLLANRDVTLFKSNDGGQTVFKESDALYNLWGSVFATAVHPTDPSIIYIARGPCDATKMSLYKSTDFGKTFGSPIAFPQPTGAYITGMAIDSSNPNTMYISTGNQGVLKSTDGGINWAAINTGLPSDHLVIYDIAIDPKNPSRLAVASPYYGQNGFVAITTNGGGSWTVTLGRDSSGTNLISTMDARCVAFDPDPSVNVLYAGNRDYSSRGSNKILWRSTDGGTTWSYIAGTVFNTRPSPYNTSRYYYLKTLATDAAKPGRVYAGFTGEEYDYNLSDGVFYSDDYGVTWAALATPPSGGLPAYRITRLDVDPQNTSRIYASTGGNGTWYYGTPPAREPIGIACWRFDETTGTSANDSFTNNYDGTLVSGTAWNTGGKYNGCANLDGSDDYVDVGSNCPQLNPGTSAYMFNAWVYPLELDSTIGGSTPVYDEQDADLPPGQSSDFYDNVLFCKYQDVSNRFYFNFRRSDWIQFYAMVNGVEYDAQFTDISSNLQFTKNNWHMLSVVIDRHAGTLTAYHNGDLIGTATYASTVDISNAGQFQIGRYNTTGGHFYGRMDDLRFYRNAFTQDEIKKWFMSQAYWKMNQIASDGKLHDENEVNNATSANVTCHAKGSAVFNGVNAFANAGTNDSLKPGTGDFSVAFWIKPTALLPTNSYAGILFKGNGDIGVQDGWIVRYMNTNGIGDRLYFHLGNGTYNMGGVFLPGWSQPLTANQWSHVAFVVKRSTKTIQAYLNGVLTQTATLNDGTMPYAVNGPALRMGNDWDNAHLFQGELDEVRIYNWALTSDVLQLDKRR